MATKTKTDDTGARAKTTTARRTERAAPKRKAAVAKSAATRSAAAKSATAKSATAKNAGTRNASTKSGVTRSATMKSAPTKSPEVKGTPVKSHRELAVAAPVPATTARPRSPAAVAKSPVRRQISDRDKAFAVGAAALAAGAIVFARKRGKSAAVPATPASPVRFEHIEGAVDAGLVNRTIQLLAKENRKSEAGLHRVGTYLVEHYFDGQEELVGTRRPHLGRSWELLGQRAGTKGEWTTDDLWRAVESVVASRTLPDRIEALAGRFEQAVDGALAAASDEDRSRLLARLENMRSRVAGFIDRLRS